MWQKQSWVGLRTQGLFLWSTCMTSPHICCNLQNTVPKILRFVQKRRLVGSWHCEATGSGSKIIFLDHASMPSVMKLLWFGALVWPVLRNKGLNIGHLLPFQKLWTKFCTVIATVWQVWVKLACMSLACSLPLKSLLLKDSLSFLKPKHVLTSSCKWIVPKGPKEGLLAIKDIPFNKIAYHSANEKSIIKRPQVKRWPDTQSALS